MGAIHLFLTLYSLHFHFKTIPTQTNDQRLLWLILHINHPLAVALVLSSTTEIGQTLTNTAGSSVTCVTNVQDNTIGFLISNQFVQKKPIFKFHSRNSGQIATRTKNMHRCKKSASVFSFYLFSAQTRSPLCTEEYSSFFSTAAVSHRHRPALSIRSRSPSTPPGEPDESCSYWSSLFILHSCLPFLLVRERTHAVCEGRR